MMLDNYFYGNKFVLENFCKIKKKTLCFASIQHGWLSKSSAQKTNLGKRFFNIYPYITWNSNLKKLLIKNKIKNVHAIGAPFLYLNDKKKNAKINEKGTIVFPAKCHFRDNSLIRVNHEKLIELVQKKHRGPFTVSLFYNDLNQEIVKVYKKKKWKIVCFGERLNPYFLYKLFVQLKKHKNIVFTSIVSTLFYSFYLKKKTFLLLNFRIKNKILPIKTKIYNTEKSDETFYIKKYPFILKKNQQKKKYNLSLAELGFKDMKTKQELKELLFSPNIIQKCFAILFYIKDKFVHRTFLKKEFK
jgi:hypothetical protein